MDLKFCRYSELRRGVETRVRIKIICAGLPFAESRKWRFKLDNTRPIYCLLWTSFKNQTWKWYAKIRDQHSFVIESIHPSCVPLQPPAQKGLRVKLSLMALITQVYLITSVHYSAWILTFFICLFTVIIKLVFNPQSRHCFHTITGELVIHCFLSAF